MAGACLPGSVSHSTWSRLLAGRMLGRLAVRYPEVPVIFAGSRRFAEEWAYRFLRATAADRVESP